MTDGALAGGVVDNCIGFYNHKYFILMASTASFIPSIAGHRNSANGQNDRVGEVLVSLLVAYGWMLCLSTFIMIALKYVWIGYSVRLSLSLYVTFCCSLTGWNLMPFLEFRPCKPIIYPTLIRA